MRPIEQSDLGSSKDAEMVTLLFLNGNKLV